MNGSQRLELDYYQLRHVPVPECFTLFAHRPAEVQLQIQHLGLGNNNHFSDTQLKLSARVKAAVT
jgi:hypothetical protein